MTPLLRHPLWPPIQPWVRIETYDRDGGHDDPRHRIELDAPNVPGFRAVVTTMVVDCAACGRSIHPFRPRNGDASGHLYVAVTCPLDERMGCARGRAASEAYSEIVDAVTTVQTKLFP